MRKIGLIINPYAKKSRKMRGLVESLTNRFPDPDNVWVPKNLDELSAIAKKILEDRIEILFLSGGDGTFRATVEALLSHKSSHPLPIFLPLQGGTGCLYSKHYYGSRNPVKHLNQALEKLNQSNEISVTTINILNVNGHYGFIFAIGGFSNLISYYMSHKERSLLLANWLILRLAISFIFKTSFYKKIFPTIPIHLKDKHHSRFIDITTLACSSIPVGYIAQPFYGIERNQSFSGILFLKSPFHSLKNFASIVFKKPIKNDSAETLQSDSIDLFLPHPLPQMIDGDMLDPATEINVKLGPEIRLLQL